MDPESKGRTEAVMRLSSAGRSAKAGMLALWMRGMEGSAADEGSMEKFVTYQGLEVQSTVLCFVWVGWKTA
jgi:hypothetical protein